MILLTDEHERISKYILTQIRTFKDILCLNRR
jgi:hypothetical protein